MSVSIVASAAGTASGRGVRSETRAGEHYRPDIDGLRAIAVAMVLLFHFGVARFQGGFAGVDVFFVISGYVITKAFSGRNFPLLDFYERRARRLLPALAVVILATFVGCYFLFLEDSFTEFSRHLRALGMFSSNWSFAEVGYFDGPALHNPLLHTWTLCVEAQFYLVAPLVMLCLRGRRRLMALAFGLLTLASFLFGLVLARGTDLPGAYYNSFGRFWEIGLGATAAALPLAIPAGLASTAVRITGVLLIVTTTFLLQPGMPFPGSAALLPTIGALLVIICSEQHGDPLYRALASPPMVFVGKISYSLYLWHWPILVFADVFWPRSSPTITLGVALAAIALAAASYFLVERPTRTLRLRLPLPFLVATAAFSAMTVGAGELGLMTHGLPTRLPPTVAKASAGLKDVGPGAARCDTTNWLIFGVHDRPEAHTEPCLLGRSDKAPTFMLVGDSHSIALIAEFDKIASEESIAGIAIGYNSCAPIITLENKSKNAPGCSWLNSRVIGALPVSRVVLAGRWTSYVDKAMYPPSSFDPEKLFRDGVEATLAKFPKRTSVVVLGEVPQQGQLVPNALALDALLYRTHSWALTRVEHERATAFVNDYFRKLATQGRIKFIDLGSALCASADCLVEVDDRPLYSDTNHLTNFGAAYLADVLRNALR